MAVRHYYCSLCVEEKRKNPALGPIPKFTNVFDTEDVFKGDCPKPGHGFRPVYRPNRIRRFLDLATRFDPAGPAKPLKNGP
jgi:hypothetical protein